VRILFDANTPAPLARFLAGHEVVRADELGWQNLHNGALLDAAEQAGFDLLLTCDQNVLYQQNFTGRSLSLAVLSSNHWPTLRSVAARIASRIEFVQAGQSGEIVVKR
jgi:predicted nuclease of predicted toxin-antitoxin system